MNRHQLFGLAAIMIGISIAFGALGAHLLEKLLSAHYLDVWKTGCLYFAINGLGLLAVANALKLEGGLEDRAAAGATGVAEDASAAEAKGAAAAEEAKANGAAEVAKSTSPWYIKSIIFGAMIFSISLWIVAFNEQVSPVLRKFAIITPFGGVAMIVGWLMLGWVFWKK